MSFYGAFIRSRGKYKGYQPNPKLGNIRPDLALKMNNGKFLVIEIELFNKVSKEKITKIHNKLEDLPHDIWIVSKWQSNKRDGRVNINDIKKLSNYY